MVDSIPTWSLFLSHLISNVSFDERVIFNGLSRIATTTIVIIVTIAKQIGTAGKRNL